MCAAADKHAIHGCQEGRYGFRTFTSKREIEEDFPKSGLSGYEDHLDV
jgi:hypothetical protein